MKIGQSVISGEQLRFIWSPCIYTVKQEDAVLYIGASAYGYTRIFTIHPKREVRRSERQRLKAFEEGDQIVVEFFSTKQEAFAEETRLIHEHHPKYNKFCDVCGKHNMRIKRLKSDEARARKLVRVQNQILQYHKIPFVQSFERLRRDRVLLKIRPDLFKP